MQALDQEDQIKATEERDRVKKQQKKIIDCIMKHRRQNGIKIMRFSSEMFNELGRVMLITSMICLTIENPNAFTYKQFNFRYLLRKKYAKGLPLF